MTPNQERTLIVLGSIIAVLLIVLIVVLLGGDDPVVSQTSTSAGTAAATEPSQTTVAAATTSEASPATNAPGTTASPAPTAAPAGACSGLPAPAIPPPGPGVTRARGDFDGDGADDLLIGHVDGLGTWWVQMALSYGYATQTAVPGPVSALGSDDFGSGQSVGYAGVDSGASTQIVGFFFAPGCDVFEVTITGGALARFPIGGGVTHLDGLRCTADGITTTSATTADGLVWEYTTTDYAWVPGLVEFQPTASSIALLNSPADDATIFSAAEFDCPDTAL